MNGKFYIGSAVQSFKQRWYLHKSHLRNGKHHSLLLQRAWNKCGEEAFVFSIIEITLPCIAVAREQFFLDSLRPWDRSVGYNIAKDATAPMKGRKQSDEFRLAQSARTKKMNADPEFKAASSARSKAMFADPAFSAVHSARMFVRMTAMNADPEFKAASSARLTAQRADPEFLASLAAGGKAYRDDPETKAVQSSRFKALHANPKFKSAIAAGSKAYYGDPIRLAAGVKKAKETKLRKKIARADAMLVILD